MRLNNAADRAAYRAAMIPTGAVRDQRSTQAGEAYCYLAGNRPTVIAFWGSSGRPTFHYSYRTEEERAKRLDDFFASLASSVAYKADRAAKRKAFVHDLKTGDILRCSWGYDQTNVEYFQVLRTVGEKKVEIRAIASESVPGTQGFMSESVKPAPGRFLERQAPMVKLVGEGNSVLIHSFAHAYKCSTTETSYSSWYA
jgi:hypothetical protein